MKLLASIFIPLAVASAAHSACVGSGSFVTCTDSSGNTYNIQRYGNTTYMQGSNPYTGSNWSQQSSTYSNTTYHNGIAADGSPWSGSTTRIGGTTFHQGIDSKGNPYSRTCNAFGCY